MRGSARLWVAACLIALGATVALAVVLKSKLKRQALPPVARTPEPTRDAGSSCVVPPVIPMRPLPDAEDPPVILWAVRAVRIFVDGAPAFSSPESPKHFKVGEHDLKLEAPGAQPLKTRVRLDAFTPALFHAEMDGPLGLNLARVGAFCMSCAEPLDEVKLDFKKAEVLPEVLLASAADALRRDDWIRARTFLLGVPPPARAAPSFHRLAAGVYLDTVQPSKARAELDLIPDRDSNDLRALLKQWDGLNKSEQARRNQVMQARWNKVTERFQGLIDRFNTQAPGPTANASRRLAELSQAFGAADKESKRFEQEQLLATAEATLLSVVVQIRAARPGDCDFQANVVTTVMR